MKEGSCYDYRCNGRLEVFLGDVGMSICMCMDRVGREEFKLLFSVFHTSSTSSKAVSRRLSGATSLLLSSSSLSRGPSPCRGFDLLLGEHQTAMADLPDKPTDQYRPNTRLQKSSR